MGFTVEQLILVSQLFIIFILAIIGSNIHHLRKHLKEGK